MDTVPNDCSFCPRVNAAFRRRLRNNSIIFGMLIVSSIAGGQMIAPYGYGMAAETIHDWIWILSD